MAELTIANPSNKFNRSKKSTIRVDLTPMVDLGFLLITFFMLTTTLSRPKAMHLFLPANGKPMLTPVSKSLTILIDSGDNIDYYEGEIDVDHPPEIIKTSYDELTGIGNIIRIKQQQVAEKYGNAGETFIIIKPSSMASYAHVVAVLDEMNINHVTKYALADITPAEIKWLSQSRF